MNMNQATQHITNIRFENINFATIMNRYEKA